MNAKLDLVVGDSIGAIEVVGFKAFLLDFVFLFGLIVTLYIVLISQATLIGLSFK